MEWSRAEDEALLRAWEEAVGPPRGRELTPNEHARICARLAALGAPRGLRELTRRLQQVLLAFHFISAFDRQTQRVGSAGWFELPGARRAAFLSSAMPGEDGEALGRVDRTFYDKLRKVCGEEEQQKEAAELPRRNEDGRLLSSSSGEAREGGESSGGAEESEQSQDLTPGYSRAGISQQVENEENAEETASAAATDAPGEASGAGVRTSEDSVPVQGPPSAESPGDDLGAGVSTSGDSVPVQDPPSAQSSNVEPSEDMTASNEKESTTSKQIPGEEELTAADWPIADWRRFISAWEAAAKEFVELGNIADEVVKLPNWLILQEWTRLGGGKELRVDMVHAKKEVALVAYQIAFEFARRRRFSEAWFVLPFETRKWQQVRLFHDKSKVLDPPGILAGMMDKRMFNQLDAIVEQEAVLASTGGPPPIGHTVNKDDASFTLVFEAELRARTPWEQGQHAKLPAQPSTGSDKAHPDSDDESMENDVVLLETQDEPPSTNSQAIPSMPVLVIDAPDNVRHRDQRSEKERSKSKKRSRPNGSTEQESHVERPAIRRHAATNFSRSERERITALIDSSQRAFERSVAHLREERLREHDESRAFLCEALRRRLQPAGDRSRRTELMKELALHQSRQWFKLTSAVVEDHEYERREHRRLLYSLKRGGHPGPHTNRAQSGQSGQIEAPVRLSTQSNARRMEQQAS